jgi:Flp pilus assembly protein TadG
MRRPGTCDNQAEGVRGSTIVEFALVFPLFAMLLFGIMEFGWYFFVQHTLQYATREGTRLALVGATLTDPHGNPMTRAASIVETIQNDASLAVNPSQIAISIFPITAPYTNPSGWQGEQNAGNPGDYMRVVTQYTYTFLTPLIGQFFPGGSVIQATTTYQNQMFPAGS